ncbi:hypothetical protein [Leifsonia poae]|uniref:hypothetical protein n=1 Tax=Leifsonia poae TaxID=110933 RepID=UPI001CBFB62B|nr:hypothetical protein [Leifsonia poae]
MTAITPEAAILRTTPASAHRIWRVVRLNLVNKWTTIWLPIIIMGFIWLVNYLIWWIIWFAAGPDGRAHALNNTEWSGGGLYIFVYMLVLGIQVVSQTFPFSLGYSVTRRDFSLGSALTFVMLAAGYAVGYTVLGIVEKATNGWGLGAHLFTTVYFGDFGIWGNLFIVFVGMLFFLFVGSTSATIFLRWKVNGMLLAGAILILLLIAIVALITVTGGWPAVGSWFIAMGTLGVTAWLLIPTALAAVTGYFVLLRATPKS